VTNNQVSFVGLLTCCKDVRKFCTMLLLTLYLWRLPCLSLVLCRQYIHIIFDNRYR